MVVMSFNDSKLDLTLPRAASEWQRLSILLMYRLRIDYQFRYKSITFDRFQSVVMQLVSHGHQNYSFCRIPNENLTGVVTAGNYNDLSKQPAVTTRLHLDMV